MVEHPIITFNPNRPKHDVVKEVPNLDFLNKVYRNPFPVESLFSMETIIVARSNPTKFVHDESHPPPCSSGFYAILNLMLNQFTSVRKAKNALIEVETWTIHARHSLTATTFCQMDHIMHPLCQIVLSSKHVTGRMGSY